MCNPRISMSDKVKPDGSLANTNHSNFNTNHSIGRGLNTQIGGNHYLDMKLQPLEATYLNFGYLGLKASVYTKVLKYFRSKDNELEDLQKARHCIDILIEKAAQELADV